MASSEESVTPPSGADALDDPAPAGEGPLVRVKAAGPQPAASDGWRPWARELCMLGFILIGVYFVRTSLFSPYVIPTGSMLPTIKIDDRVMANKLAYGLMLPGFDGQVVSWATPARGDIVLFQSPVEDHTFVKRVVGIEGDRIRFKEGVLHINGTPVEETVQADRSVLDDMGDSATDKAFYLESGVGEKPHAMLRMTAGGTTFFESREFAVPQGRVFCLGDNRDGSNDSRFWGFVEVKKIYGRATRVLYSTVRHEGWLPRFRTDRFFKPLD